MVCPVKEGTQSSVTTNPVAAPLLRRVAHPPRRNHEILKDGDLCYSFIQAVAASNMMHMV